MYYRNRIHFNPKYNVKFRKLLTHTLQSPIFKCRIFRICYNFENLVILRIFKCVLISRFICEMKPLYKK